MKLAIMQPYFFPYIGYFQLINLVDKFVIYDDVNYINKGWINRNRILINQEPSLFTVPLKKISQNKNINELELQDFELWKSKFFKKLEMSYKKAPYFDMAYDVVNKSLNRNYKFINELNLNIILSICEYLQINTQFVSTSVDYQNSNLKAQERIIDICKQEKASNYFNPIGGVELYSAELFRKNGINLSFIKSNEIVYNQFGSKFTPFLSIIDNLMFNDIYTIKKQLLSYELL